MGPGILTDERIKFALTRGSIGIEPFDERLLQPASYDMILSDEIARITHGVEIIDPRAQQEYTSYEKIYDEERGFLIYQGEFILASSVEVFSFNASHVGQINGKSSLARLGLQVESAGFFDPGFRGQATLELVNMAQRPIRLYPGMKIAQMVFFETPSPAARPYGHAKLGSKYRDQMGPTPSRMHLDHV